MSGGSFNYAYARTIEFGETLRNRLDSQGDGISGDAQPVWKELVSVKLMTIAYAAQVTGAMMKEAEWLYSGDIGEETFLGRIKDIEKTLIEQIRRSIEIQQEERHIDG
jgi:hypothetical protein